MKFTEYWVPYTTGRWYYDHEKKFKSFENYVLRDTIGNGNMSFEFFLNLFPSTGLIYEIK